MVGAEGWKTNADTTKMSPEEVSKLNLHSSKRPPGQSPGGVLHQQGGAGLSRAGSYPVALAGVLVLAGVGTWAYYRQSHPAPMGQAGQHSPNVQKEAAEKTKQQSATH
ncbi:hypothetical protein MPTK1_3g06800 [Marchantia polymorpha subsp. ruderalis]|uniref:Uncharacterized protein n=2 Tax=Marchantia polymorpha TaxID=3197 RepID=A0AAF6AY47_MARPO|nr:hypothetical protein MARPO_0006s0148 [Marchantia polymorpha]BBN04681.1 hypothetical protein Mp_3g06800 [Marchantia polymorpha subsp. ruderalis]|eukprot:PTQ48119.1 hypothetical protein MARPO_0006s0148 [Marchantia polymorpha]